MASTKSVKANMTMSVLMISDILLSLRSMMSIWLSRNTAVAIVLPQRQFGSAAPLSTYWATSMIVLASLGEAILLRGVEQTYFLGYCHGLAVAAVAVGDELAAAIETEVLGAMADVNPRV